MILLLAMKHEDKDIQERVSEFREKYRTYRFGNGNPGVTGLPGVPTLGDGYGWDVEDEIEYRFGKQYRLGIITNYDNTTRD